MAVQLLGGALWMFEMAAQVPGIPLPDGFQSWPVTAILGLITLSAMAALVFVFRNTYRTMHESSVTTWCLN